MSDVRSSVMGGSYARPADASARIQFRRALTLTAMTLVMPGSAQLVMGNRKIGRIGVRIWLAFLALGALPAVPVDDVAHGTVLAADQPAAADARPVRADGGCHRLGRADHRCLASRPAAGDGAQPPALDDRAQQRAVLRHRRHHVLRRPPRRGAELVHRHGVRLRDGVRARGRPLQRAAARRRLRRPTAAVCAPTR